VSIGAVLSIRFDSIRSVQTRYRENPDTLMDSVSWRALFEQSRFDPLQFYDDGDRVLLLVDGERCLPATVVQNVDWEDEESWTRNRDAVRRYRRIFFTSCGADLMYEVELRDLTRTFAPAKWIRLSSQSHVQSRQQTALSTTRRALRVIGTPMPRNGHYLAIVYQ
jgi:hypothetical protein